MTRRWQPFRLNKRSPVRTLTLPNDILIPQIRKVLEEGHTATFRVRGVSMRPFLEDGRDKVLLEPLRRAPRVGDVVLAEVEPKRYVLHRIVRIEGERITMRGDGNVRGTEEFDRKHIIGIATAFFRKGRNRPDSVTGTKWKLYSRIWLALTPLRRWILAAYRRIWLKVFPVKEKAEAAAFPQRT